MCLLPTRTGVLHDGDRLQPVLADDREKKKHVLHEILFHVTFFSVLKQRRVNSDVRFFEIHPVNSQVRLGEGLLATSRTFFEEFESVKVSWWV